MTGGVSRAASKLVDTNLDRGWGVNLGERCIFCANSSNRNDVGLLTIQKGVWGSRIGVVKISQGVGVLYCISIQRQDDRLYTVYPYSARTTGSLPGQHTWLSQRLLICEALIAKYN
jgi:hypothetical protein